MSDGTGRPAAAAAGWLLDRAVRWSGARVGLALVYHGVSSTSTSADRLLLPPEELETFRRQIQAVARRYHVVPAGQLRDAVAGRRRGARIPLAVTFDDDLRSHLDEVVPVLSDAGIPATFFLTGAGLDAPVRFWWETFDAALAQGVRVDRVVERYGLDPGAVTRGSLHAIGIGIEAMAEERRRALTAELDEMVGPPPDTAGLRADDVRRLVGSGCEIGFHTREHPTLPNLDDDALARALRDGRDRLAAAAGSPLTTIAYPHGAWDERVARAARAAGWKAGYTLDGDPVRGTDDPLATSRIDPFGEPAPGLLRRLALTALRGASGKPIPG